MNNPPTVIPLRLTKSQLANQYGAEWRSIKSIIHEIIPELEGNRRRLLFPKEIRKIYEELGYPDQINFFNERNLE